MINYFQPPATPKEAIIRRIKGNYRRLFVARGIQTQGTDAVPAEWKKHNISDVLKGWLGQQNPRFRGGEDLPDLEKGEVEIARLTLADSIHGEVTSLRAKQAKEEGKISLRMVDEYESDITLPYHIADMPLTSEEVIRLFRDAHPSLTRLGCEIELDSFFHPDLDDVAKVAGVK
jgi:hypothetical protein